MNKRKRLEGIKFLKKLYEVRTTFLGAGSPSSFYFDTKEKARDYLEEQLNGEINTIIIESNDPLNYSDCCTYDDLTYGGYNDKKYWYEYELNEMLEKYGGYDNVSCDIYETLCLLDPDTHKTNDRQYLEAYANDYILNKWGDMSNELLDWLIDDVVTEFLEA